MAPRTQTPEEKLQRLVRRLRRSYGGLAIVLLLIEASTIFAGSDVLTPGLLSLVCASLYFGLRLRRAWVVPLVLFTSVGLCVALSFAILRPAADVVGVIGKLIAFAALLFFAYQFSLFRRSEMRRIFEDRGPLVF
jgi:hypothetical protein